MDIYFAERGYGKTDPLYGTELNISPSNSIRNDVDIQVEGLHLLDNQVNLFDVSTRQMQGNESLDLLNALQKYKAMRIKCSKAFKSNELSKREALPDQVLKAEIKNLKECKEHLDNQMERQYLEKTFENIDWSIISTENSTFPYGSNFKREAHETLDYDQKSMKTFCNSKYLELQKHKPVDHANPYVVEKNMQSSNISSDNFAPHIGACLKSSGTQTDMIDNFSEFSSLIDLLNDVTSKYNNLCLEKAVLETNLMHAITEKQMESTKVVKEREIRQKCLDKMTKLKDERDAAVAEYRLVMSERDVVHKEINQLQDQLAEQTTQLGETRKRIDYLERSRRTQTEDRTEEEMVMMEFDQILSDARSPGNFAGRPVSIPTGPRVNQGPPEGGDDLTAGSVWMHNNFNESDSLKRQLQQTISEFTKRDRIVRERDSMRTMCDKLRQDRDDTVKELIRAKKESDEMRKQRNQAVNDLKTFKEIYTSNGSNSNHQSREEDESISHSYSKDSAIDSDFQDWETELINLDVGSDSIGNLGFELAGGYKEGGTGQHVYIKNILPCSLAYGVIQVNDQIVQVNSVDVTRADKSVVCQLIRQSPRPINMLIKRKKSCSKLYPATSQFLPSASPHPRSSKLDLPPLPLSCGSIGRQHQPKSTICCSTNPYGPTLEESNSRSGSEKFRHEGEVTSSEVTSRRNEHSKEKRSVHDEAFAVLSKPFKSLPRDVRSKSTAKQPDVSLLALDMAHKWNSKQNTYRETWPKCRNHWRASAEKKLRPRLNFDTTSKDENNLTKGLDDGEDPTVNSSTKIVRKSSFVYHYIQKPDPLTSDHPIQKSREDDLGGVVNDLADVDNDLGSERHVNDLEDLTDSTRASSSSQHNPFRESDDQKDMDAINLIDFNDEITTHEHKPVVSELPVDSNINNRFYDDDNANHTPESRFDPNIENRRDASVEASAHRSFLGSFPPNELKTSTHHRDILNSPDQTCLFAFNAEGRNVFNEDDELWKNPPAHQVLRAVEERVSGTMHRQQGKDLNSYLLHRCGTAGKMRKVCPNNVALKICLNQGGTRTLPHLNSHCNNAKKSSIFSTYGDHSYGNFPMSNVTDLLPLNYDPQSMSLPGIYIDQLSNGSFPAFLSRMESHRLFNSPPSVPLVSPSHTFASMIPLNSNTTDAKNPFSQPFQGFVSSSKSDALLDVKQKLCRRLEVDYASDVYLRNGRELFGNFSKGNFGIFDSTGSVMSSLRNVRTSHDASESSLISFGTRVPNTVMPRFPNKHHTLPVTMSCRSDFVHNSLPNSSDFHKEMSMTSFMDVNEEGFSFPRLYGLARKTRKYTSSVDSPANTTQRNSEPADFNAESVRSDMQKSSMSDNGLIFRLNLQTSEPFRDTSDISTTSAKSSNKFNEQAVDVDDSLTNRQEEDGPDNDVQKSNFMSTSDHVLTDPGDEVIQYNLQQHQSTATNKTECVVREIATEKKLTNESLKIKVMGGNTVGIFVKCVAEESLLAGPLGLKVGDRILEFNDISFCDMILEEAVLELNKPCREVRMRVQHSMDVYKRIQNHPCDSLYVRALFDQPSGIGGELTFCRGDVLFVDNTYYNNKVGVWWAYLIDGEGLKTRCGTVVSRINRPADESAGRYFFDLKSPPQCVASNGSMRRSFFKRRKHQTVQTTRDDMSPSDTSEAELLACIPDDEFYGLYERVEKLDPYSSRPVLIVGTFANQMIAKLSKDFPCKFYRFIPEFGRRKCDNGSITYGTETGGIASIPVNLLRNSMAFHHHSLVNFPIDLVNKFVPHEIHFIVILIKYKSYKQIKEAKDPQYILERTSTRQAREMYEASVTMERKYKQLISEIVTGGSLQSMCASIVEAVDREQNKPIWLPCQTTSCPT